jgi:hypothetical protein
VLDHSLAGAVERLGDADGRQIASGASENFAQHRRCSRVSFVVI